jgi:hypothetical protein
MLSIKTNTVKVAHFGFERSQALTVKPSVFMVRVIELNHTKRERDTMCAYIYFTHTPTKITQPLTHNEIKI